MKVTNVKKFTSGGSLISSILLLVLGILLITRPDTIIRYTVYAVGIVAILIGIYKLLIFYKTNESRKEIINGLVFLLLGMTAIICNFIVYESVEIVAKYTISVFLLYIGINRLISSFKEKGKKRLINLVMAAVVIALGIILAFIDNSISRFIGIFITLYAISEIAAYICTRKVEVKEEEIKEANILIEKDNNEEVKMIETK